MYNEQHIWNWLKQCSGLNDFAIAAIMGNMEHESAGYPNNVENTCPLSDASYTEWVDNGRYSREQFVNDKYGYGLCQWTYPTRKANLYDFAKKKCVSISDMDMQLEFLVKELMTQFPGVWNVLIRSTCIETPCDKVLCDFENPDQIESKKAERRKSAIGIYNRMHGNDATCSTSASTATSASVNGNTASPVPSPVTMCSPSLPVLKKGSIGIAVRVLQASLLQRGCKLPTFGIDGDFGSETENAVKLFQASGKLSATGIVDEKTYEQLFK